MMIQHFRNALSIVGAFVFVFGGLYLIDEYSGWRPFEGLLANAEVNGSVAALSSMAESGSDSRQASNDFSGSQNETLTRQDRYDAKTDQDSPMRRGRQSILLE